MWLARVVMRLGIAQARNCSGCNCRSLQSSKGGSVSLKSFKGRRPVVLFFYPKAGTPGCTKEVGTELTQNLLLSAWQHCRVIWNCLITVIMFFADRLRSSEMSTKNSRMLVLKCLESVEIQFQNKSRFLHLRVFHIHCLLMMEMFLERYISMKRSAVVSKLHILHLTLSWGLEHYL